MNLILRKPYSRADMCLNCSPSVKSMKFGIMIVYKALKKIVYGAIAKKSVKARFKRRTLQVPNLIHVPI